MVTATSTSFPSMEEEALDGDITEEVRQPMQGIQSTPSIVPIIT